MFRIKIVCVGTLKEKYFVDALDEYKKRLSKFCNLKIIELKEAEPSKTKNEIIDIESNEIKKYLSGFVIVLDSHGKQFESQKFAQFLDDKMVHGQSEFTFVIGGSYGIMEKLKKDANILMSFGKITLPHQLARVVLIEQIYRAFTILGGTSYHK